MLSAEKDHGIKNVKKLQKPKGLRLQRNATLMKYSSNFIAIFATQSSKNYLSNNTNSFSDILEMLHSLTLRLESKFKQYGFE